MFGLPKLPDSTIITVKHFQRVIGGVANMLNVPPSSIPNRKNKNRPVKWGEFKKAICCMATSDCPIHIPDKNASRMVTIGDIKKYLCCVFECAKDGTPSDPLISDIALLKTAEVDGPDGSTAPYTEAVNVGDAIYYTLVISNNGPEDATNVVWEDVLPAEVTFDSVTVGTGTFDGTSTVSGTIPSIPAGGSETITIKVIAATAGATVSNTAGVTGLDQVDDNPSNDDSTFDIEIINCGEITLLKAGELATTFEVGNIINYRFRVHNTGNCVLTDISIDDPKLGLTGYTDANFVDPLDPANLFTTEYVPYTITQADVDAGEVVNTATVNAEDPNGNPVSDVSDDAAPNELPGNDSSNDTGEDDDPTIIVAPELVADLYITKVEVEPIPVNVNLSIVKTLIVPPESRVVATDPDVSTGVSQITVTNTKPDSSAVPCGECARIVVETRDAGSTGAWTLLEEITGITGQPVSTYTTTGGADSIVPHIVATDILFDCTGTGSTVQFDKKNWADSNDYNYRAIEDSISDLTDVAARTAAKDIRFTTYVGGSCTGQTSTDCPVESINPDNQSEICSIYGIIGGGMNAFIDIGDPDGSFFSQFNSAKNNFNPYDAVDTIFPTITSNDHATLTPVYIHATTANNIQYRAEFDYIPAIGDGCRYTEINQAKAWGLTYYAQQYNEIQQPGVHTYSAARLGIIRSDNEACTIPDINLRMFNYHAGVGSVDDPVQNPTLTVTEVGFTHVPTNFGGTTAASQEDVIIPITTTGIYTIELKWKVDSSQCGITDDIISIMKVEINAMF